MTDECHSAGFIGKTGRGVPEYCNVMGRVDIITGTLGKALGGAMGGYTTGKKEIIEILRQRSRPYFSRIHWRLQSSEQQIKCLRS
jgi:glycine C-acetyltransferase